MLKRVVKADEKATGGAMPAAAQGDFGSAGRLLNWDRLWRRLIIVALYAAVIFVCRWIAYELRFDFDVPALYRPQQQSQATVNIVFTLLWLALFGQFSGIYKYFRQRARIT